MKQAKKSYSDVDKKILHEVDKKILHEVGNGAPKGASDLRSKKSFRGDDIPDIALRP